MPAVKLQGEPATEGLSQYMRLLEPECLDEGGEGVGVVARTEMLGRIRGLAAPRHIPGHHRELVRESVELAAPFPAIRRPAVQQDKRWAFACSPVGDTKPFQLDLFHAGLHGQRQAWPHTG